MEKMLKKQNQVFYAKEKNIFGNNICKNYSCSLIKYLRHIDIYVENRPISPECHKHFQRRMVQ